MGTYPEIFYVVQSYLVAEKVQKSILQHAAVAIPITKYQR